MAGEVGAQPQPDLNGAPLAPEEREEPDEVAAVVQDREVAVLPLDRVEELGESRWTCTATSCPTCRTLRRRPSASCCLELARETGGLVVFVARCPTGRESSPG